MRKTAVPDATWEGIFPSEKYSFGKSLVEEPDATGSDEQPLPSIPETP